MLFTNMPLSILSPSPEIRFLRVVLSRLINAWNEAQVRPYCSAPAEPLRVLKGQNEGQGEESYPWTCRSSSVSGYCSVASTSMRLS